MVYELALQLSYLYFTLLYFTCNLVYVTWHCLYMVIQPPSHKILLSQIVYHTCFENGFCMIIAFSSEGQGFNTRFNLWFKQFQQVH